MPVHDWRRAPVQTGVWSVDACPQLVGSSRRSGEFECRISPTARGSPASLRPRCRNDLTGESSRPDLSRTAVAGRGMADLHGRSPRPIFTPTHGRSPRPIFTPRHGRSPHRSRRLVRHPSGCVAQSKAWQDPLRIGPRLRLPTRSRTPLIELRRVASPRRGTTSECFSPPRVRRSNACFSRSI